MSLLTSAGSPAQRRSIRGGVIIGPSVPEGLDALSPAQQAFYLARVQKTGSIGALPLSEQQVQFIDRILLPIAKSRAVLSSPGLRDEHNLRPWRYEERSEGREQVVILDGFKSPIRLELIWSREDSRESPEVVIDESKWLHQLLIPYDLNIPAVEAEAPLVDRWRSTVLLFLEGHELYPHYYQPDRIRFGEAARDQNVVELAMIEAAQRLRGLGQHALVLVGPPNCGLDHALTRLAVESAIDQAKNGRKLHLILSQRIDDLELVQELCEREPKRDQVRLMSAQELRGANLKKLVDLGDESAKPIIALLTTSALRSLMRSHIAQLLECEDDEHPFDAILAEVGEGGTTRGMDEALTRRIGLMSPSTMFQRFGASLAGVSFVDAEHAGAPSLFPLLKILKNSDPIDRWGISSTPVHHQRNVLTDLFDGNFYPAFKISPRYYLGLLRQQTLRGDTIMYQLSECERSGLAVPLGRAYALVAEQIMQGVPNDKIWSKERDGTAVLDRDNPLVYFSVLTKFLPLILKHEHIDLYTSSRDEAVSITDFLNHMFAAIPAGQPQRRAGYYIDGRTETERLHSAQTALDFDGGKVNVRVLVERDGGPEHALATCMIDLSTTSSVKRFERRFGHLVAPRLGKDSVDLGMLLNRNAELMAAQYDFLLAVKTGLFRSAELIRDHEPAIERGQARISTENFDSLYSEIGYQKLLEQALLFLEEAKVSIWQEAPSPVRKTVIEVSELLSSMAEAGADPHEAFARLSGRRILQGAFRRYGELLYWELRDDERKTVDALGLLAEERRRLRRDFRYLCSIPQDQDLDAIASTVKAYVEKTGDVPVLTSVVGMLLRRGLNAREKLFELLPPDIVLKIEALGGRSFRELYQQRVQRALAQAEAGNLRIAELADLTQCGYAMDLIRNAIEKNKHHAIRDAYWDTLNRQGGPTEQLVRLFDEYFYEHHTLPPADTALMQQLSELSDEKQKALSGQGLSPIAMSMLEAHIKDQAERLETARLERRMAAQLIVDAITDRNFGSSPSFAALCARPPQEAQQFTLRIWKGQFRLSRGQEDRVADALNLSSDDPYYDAELLWARFRGEERVHVEYMKWLRRVHEDNSGAGEPPVASCGAIFH